jgi:peptidyl-prolyl cis-trans isomerase SurA
MQMKKTALLSGFLFLFVCVTSAQTLLTFGNNTVSKEEFLNAFYKNSNTEKPTEKALREYLELYTRYKLKVKAAYDSRVDTEANQLAELNDFRTQVIDSYMNDETAFQNLIKEAAERSKKDIRISHIYIPLNTDNKDTVKAWKLAQDAYKELQRGTDFGNVAALYSGDTGARANKGDAGYVTAFTLPYQIENIIYALAPGKFSRPFRTPAGYHIVKNTGERKAVGNIKAAQILFAFPPDADDAFKTAAKRQADSVYNALVSGASFNELAFKYNTDRVTAGSNGEMQEFGVGTYDASFENAAFALSQPNQVAKPVLTSHGYHIIKLIARLPVMADSADAAFYDRIKAKVEKDARVKVAKTELTKKILKATGIKMAPVNQRFLAIYTDSILQRKNMPVLAGLDNNTPLFIMPREKIFISDWGNYLSSIRDMPTLSEGKTQQQLLQQFKEMVATDYYRAHLEEYNAEFARQLKEFKEGNMLFEIMQRNIWDKANTDTAGLIAHYNANREKYVWGPSADVIMFSVTDPTIVNEVRQKLTNNINDWKNITVAYEGRVQADSGRYELTQLPTSETSFKPRSFTTPIVNQSEGITTMMYIVNTYSEKSPRNFEDAKGLVLNDYQQLLEEKWLAELKQQYPVQVNEKVLRTTWQ